MEAILHLISSNLLQFSSFHAVSSVSYRLHQSFTGSLHYPVFLNSFLNICGSPPSHQYFFNEMGACLLNFLLFTGFCGSLTSRILMKIWLLIPYVQLPCWNLLRQQFLVALLLSWFYPYILQDLFQEIGPHTVCGGQRSLQLCPKNSEQFCVCVCSCLYSVDSVSVSISELCIC